MNASNRDIKKRLTNPIHFYEAVEDFLISDDREILLIIPMHSLYGLSDTTRMTTGMGLVKMAGCRLESNKNNFERNYEFYITKFLAKIAELQAVQKEIRRNCAGPNPVLSSSKSCDLILYGDV